MGTIVLIAIKLRKKRIEKIGTLVYVPGCIKGLITLLEGENPSNLEILCYTPLSRTVRKGCLYFPA